MAGFLFSYIWNVRSLEGTGQLLRWRNSLAMFLSTIFALPDCITNHLAFCVQDLLEYSIFDKLQISVPWPLMHIHILCKTPDGGNVFLTETYVYLLSSAAIKLTVNAYKHL